MKFDLHTHHDRCGHAQGKIRDYIEAAITGGLSVIGISDHSPYFGSVEDRAQPQPILLRDRDDVDVTRVGRQVEVVKVDPLPVRS